MGTRETRPIAFLDYPWVLMESPRHPMHVGALIILQAPEHAPADYISNWVTTMCEARRGTEPFNRRLVRRGLGALWPRWETLDEIELEYHVRHSALPYPGGERELGVLVSRLHRTQLDLSQPLWELHVIEGLHDDRFAIYVKVHHSLMDGVAAVRTMEAAFTTDPDRRDLPPLWAYHRPPRPTRLPITVKSRRPGQALRDAGAAVAAAVRGGRTRPYSAPQSVLNTAITPQRRVATQSLDLARIRAAARAIDGTVNDVLLAVCAGALRRYLLEIGKLPNASLVASMPVSVRSEQQADRANAISFLFARLATDVIDTRARIDLIKSSAAAAKAHLNRIPSSAVDVYTSLTMGPFIGAQVLGLGAVGRPMFNVLISNVPGPRQRLYYNGAEVLGLYPLSVLQSGQILNITALSYADQLNLAFTACSTALPHVQRLAVYLLDAFDELEQAYGLDRMAVPDTA